MGRRDDGQQGMAAVEIALVMVFVLAPLTLCLIEGGRTISTYSALREASRAAARQVVVSGETTDVNTLIRSVASTLDPDGLNANVTYDPEDGIVTVEVAYAHTWILAGLAQTAGFDDLTLTAATSMPMP